VNIAAVSDKVSAVGSGGSSAAVAALHQGAPCQMTWLEDPQPWLYDQNITDVFIVTQPAINMKHQSLI